MPPSCMRLLTAMVLPLQRVKYLESEVDGLRKKLKDCEHALQMANNETDKANQVARDAKAKVVELDARIYQIEGELQAANNRAAGLESELRKYRAKYSEAKDTVSEKDSIIGGKESRIGSLEGKVRRIDQLFFLCTF